jgi:hypothetical protein
VIFVNLDQASQIEPYHPERGSPGTLIQFLDERMVLVREPIEELLQNSD